MRLLIISFFLCLGIHSFSQQRFPESWTGDWKGELQWFKTGTSSPQKVSMELRIHPGDSINTWTWRIIYGSKSDDNRPYHLIQQDSSGMHWLIDENNGIVLDQYWVGEKLCGVFSVQNSTILNSYRMENGKLIAEFYSMGARPINTTGNNTSESPSVDNYKVNSYQKAVLKRMN